AYSIGHNRSGSAVGRSPAGAPGGPRRGAGSFPEPAGSVRGGRETNFPKPRQGQGLGGGRSFPLRRPPRGPEAPPRALLPEPPRLLRLGLEPGVERSPRSGPPGGG